MRTSAHTFLIAALALTAAHGGGGVGELSLDRAAITGLFESALPAPTTIDLPGLPELTVRIDAPRDLEVRTDVKQEGA